MSTVVIVGPTASGKSSLAMRLATETGASIVSADSMQVYRRLDIGTAKPTPEDRQVVTHHLIDLVDPDREFTVSEYQDAGLPLLSSGDPVIIAGGSGMYVRALIDPMSLAPTDPTIRAELEAADVSDLVMELLRADPEVGKVVDLANPYRVVRAVEVFRIAGLTPSMRVASDEYRAWSTYTPRIPVTILGVDPGEGLRERTTERFGAMMAAGLLDEVASVRGDLGRTASQAVGYKELVPVLDGVIPEVQGVELALNATMALAKRQRTFFRKDPRIQWVEWHDDPDIRYQRMCDVLGQ